MAPNAPLLPAPASTVGAPSNAPAAVAQINSTSRSRTQQSRKRANADDAAYHAASGVAGGSGGTAGAKRAAPSVAPADEPRVKRKRVEGPSSTKRAGAAADRERREEREREDKEEKEEKASLVDFKTFPLEALHRYLIQFDIVPDVDPSPLTADDPPAPSSLSRLRPRAASTASPAPPSHPTTLTTTPANRPRRDPASSRRRSSRLLEDERVSGGVSVVPVLADVGDVQGVLAGVVQKHFAEMVVREVDTLAGFMLKLKTKARMAS